MKNVVDSSGWLEYFTAGANADLFAPLIEDSENLLVPVVCLYEVFKKIAGGRDTTTAQVMISDMLNGTVLPVDESVALSAAELALELKLSMADSLILASARSHSALLWTQDAHFAGLEGVEFIRKAG
jgi:predicted nucleic acid-binding protein